MEQWCCHFFSAILDQILLILAGNDDIHKSLDEFELRPDSIRDHRVAALEHLKDQWCPFFSFHSCGYAWEIAAGAVISLNLHTVTIPIHRSNGGKC